MISTINFYNKLRKVGIDFFAGVPDSILKYFGNCLCEHLSSSSHIIAANEGNAIALAAGSYIATGKVPMVYLQNSGLGNTINPLLSMADGNLYAIPVIILVGWRGQGGINDAEQHLQQGPATPKLIEAMDYPQIVLSRNEHEAFSQIDSIMQSLVSNPQPHFVLVEANTFEKHPLSQSFLSAGTMSREEALKIIASSVSDETFVVTTTGKTSREWYEVREQLSQNHSKDFLTVGSMGHTSSIALGMALTSNKDILCIDGDGSMLMHMGAVAVAGNVVCKNFRYIMVNNFSHESVGGLPTPLAHIDFENFFKSLGFQHYYISDTPESLQENIGKFMTSCASVLEIRVKQGSRDNLTRPDMSAGDIATMLRKEFA